MNNLSFKKKGDIAVQLKQMARNNIFISHTDNHSIHIIRPWFDSQQGQGLFSLPSHPDWLWSAGSLSPGVKAAKYWSWPFTSMEGWGYECVHLPLQSSMCVCDVPSNMQFRWAGVEVVSLIPNLKTNGCEWSVPCSNHFNREERDPSTYWKGATSIPDLFRAWCRREKSLSISTIKSWFLSQYLVTLLSGLSKLLKVFATQYFITVRIKVYVWRYYYLPDALQSNGIILRGIAL